MRAVRSHETGAPDVLRVEEVERPVPGAGEVLVRVAGAGVNPADNGMRAGALPIPITLPHVPGYDVSGTVEALGADVDALAVGDAVVGFLPMSGDGAAAEFVVAPAEVLVAAPSGIPLADAAALPSVGLTAWQALFEIAGLEAGQRVLIVGAGGTVGGYAVQLAKRAGAEVIATASPRSRASVLAAGADQVIDHTESAVRDAVTGQVDVLLNLAPIDPEEFEALVALVRDGGVVVSTTAWMPAPDDADRDVRSAVVFVRSDAAQLAELVGLVDSGELRIEVAERVPLSGLRSVHERIAAGTLRGKVVVVPE
jgi:NADPH:quinone reductase-like Zn-dependent oxidoreductase